VAVTTDDERPNDPTAPAQALTPEDLPSGPAPGGIYPATPDGAAAVPPGGRRRAAWPAAIAAVVVALVALLFKFGLPLLVGTAVSGVLGGMFGGPFEKLPADQRQALEQRFDVALDGSLEGRSDRDVALMVDAMLSSGLPRLGDDLLTERLHLTQGLLDGADTATCARIARAAVTGGIDRDAMTTALDAMDAASVGRWFDINITAIEANAAADPVRSVDVAEVDRVMGDVFARLTDQEAQQLTALYGGGDVPDADACDAFRAIYRTMASLPPHDLAVAALVDVSP
jgi:hypothetical protein